MQRRKLLIGMGSLAAGGAAATGTGAFSSMSADRSGNINVVNDSAGLLSLEPDGKQVWENNGELVIDTSVGQGDGQSTDGSYGVNRNSQYEFGGVTDSTWGGNEVSDYGYLVDAVDKDASFAEWYGTHFDDSGAVATDRTWATPSDYDKPVFDQDRSNDISEPFFIVQNNDTAPHDITVTFDDNISFELGASLDKTFQLKFPDVGPGEYINIALIIIAGNSAVDTSGSITVSAD